MDNFFTNAFNSLTAEEKESFIKTVIMLDGSEYAEKLRVEYYLDPSARKDGANKKCSAARVYIDGRLLGSIINNDGTESLHPSGFTLNNIGRLHIRALENSGATLEFTSLQFAYSSK